MKNKVKLITILVMGVLVTAGCFSDSNGETADEKKDTQTTEGIQTYEGSIFTVNYLDDWIYEQPQEHIIIFSGAEGTEAYDATVNFQTIELGLHYEELTDVYTHYKEQITSVGGTVSDMAVEDFIQDEETFNSIGFFAEYEDEVVFNQFIVVVDNNAGYLLQISYTAPEHIYEKYEEKALDIMDSLELVN